MKTKYKQGDWYIIKKANNITTKGIKTFILKEVKELFPFRLNIISVDYFIEIQEKQNIDNGDDKYIIEKNISGKTLSESIENNHIIYIK